MAEGVDELLTDWSEGDERAARRAHASLFQLQRRGGAPSGFAPAARSSWGAAKRACEAAITTLRRECEPTHWMLLMARDLQCKSLEELADAQPDSAAAHAVALAALVSHAAVLHELYAPMSERLVEVATRLAALEAKFVSRLGAAAGDAAMAKARKSHGKALDALRREKAAVEKAVEGAFQAWEAGA